MRRHAVSAAVAVSFLLTTPGALGARELVSIDASVQPGTILVRTSERKLYYVVRMGAAIRYPVAVGKAGKQWYGHTRVEGKYVHPAWSPPADVKRDNPKLPDVIPGGSPRNPMGARALTLFGDEYAIHGTNKPGSIGTEASYGCIRMHNRDIVDLFDRVPVGTPVVVTR
jgi:lipoprotein-anchoring transpeptidase ErfK/SrfK